MEEQSCRKKALPCAEEEGTRLIHRLNRIEGQIRGIRGMVEHGVYCKRILIQCSAVNGALKAFERELLANHLRRCLAEELQAGNNEGIDELIQTLQSLMR